MVVKLEMNSTTNFKSSQRGKNMREFCIALSVVNIGDTRKKPTTIQLLDAIQSACVNLEICSSMTNLLANPSPVVVPTDDRIVRRLLRDLDDAATYFGEGPAERRQRLAKILADLPPEERLKLQATTDKAIEGPAGKEETFYYEGCEALREARYHIAEYSIQQSNYRLDMARLKQLEPLAARLIPKQDLIERIRQFDDPESYIDEETSSTELKTLTACNFNADASLVCTSCRSGKCKIWSLPNMETYKVLRGHQQSANYITFSPNSSQDDRLEPTAANLASCAMDGSLLLWNLVDETPHTRLSEPQAWRITRIKYHPSGQYLASCCSDNSWRLWDLNRGVEILHQEGHSDAVFDLAFHPDGSLAGSASLDSFGCIWDLRSGRSIYLLEGHSKGLRTIDFSPDGYHVATGSLDNTVKIWNLRQRKLEYTIPAHVNAVSTVMFEKENGFYLATSSFDMTVKFWSSQTWAPIKSLDSYEDKVARFDLSTDSTRIVSCYSKYLKLWSAPTPMIE